MGQYPKYMHHASKPPVMVESAQQQADLGPEWSENYIYQAYPKCKYHWTSDPATVNDADEEARLGGGWADSPAAFDAYRGARPARTDQQDVVKWVDGWPVPGLSSYDRKKIKAQLLRADAAFCRLPDGQSADMDCMPFAFDGVARVLFESGILTEQILEKDVPEFVWNSSIAGGWWRFASETPRDIFPERLGHYWVWRDESRDWRGLFRAETAEWQARLLEVSAQGTKSPAESEKNESRRFEIGAPEMRMPAVPGRKPVRRSARNKDIDSALQEIAKMRPHNHEEVFRALEGRIRPPEAEPFASGRGWLLGFQRSPPRARAWLSKAWSHLELPPFARGPKLLQ